jgi:adenylate kinase
MNLVLLAPPGAGKGTQARLLQERHPFEIISTGELLREEVKLGTDVGLKIKEILDRGEFPSEDIVLAVFKDHLTKVKDRNLILDGIPRTVYQAQKVGELFEILGIKLDMVIQLAVEDQELIRRLSSRFICSTCYTPYTDTRPPREEGICDQCGGTAFTKRPDDAPEAVKTRLNVYNEQTKPLVDYYSQRGLLRSIDGMKSVEEVATQIECLLETRKC